MDRSERALCAAVCRDLFTLAGAVRVGLDDRGQPRPELSSRDLWRLLPRLLTRAADLADLIREGVPTDDTNTIRDIAAVIDGRKGKVSA